MNNLTKLTKCRVCNNNFFKKPLLIYKNLPKAAQFLPDKESLSQDEGINLEICQCSKCGLVQLNNSPVDYFREVVRATAYSRDMKIFRNNQFSEFIDKYSLNNKKIFEYGCGKGEYLILIKETGVDVSGMEYSIKSVKKCKDIGLNVFHGSIESPKQKLDYGPFDGFFIMSYLEHLPNPNTVLSGISYNLNDDGIGLIEVPNFDMILKNNLYSEFIIDHIFYFTKETLSQTLSLNGFQLLECNSIWQDYILSAVVKKRKPLNLSKFNSFKDIIHTQIKNYIEKFATKKVAIWGAGHQAFTVIALAELGGKIRYVIDSAPFKQGKYTPATKIPIVSPNTLNEDPVEAVIVMAAAYSNEVVGILQSDYPHIKNIAILEESGIRELS